MWSSGGSKVHISTCFANATEQYISAYCLSLIKVNFLLNHKWAYLKVGQTPLQTNQEINKTQSACIFKTRKGSSYKINYPNQISMTHYIHILLGFPSGQSRVMISWSCQNHSHKPCTSEKMLITKTQKVNMSKCRYNKSYTC